MARIVEYKIVEALHLAELSDVVNSFIDNGWQPFGEPKINNSNSLQPMVRYEKLEG